MALIFGSYEAFRLQNSLIGSIYPTSPQDFKGEDLLSEDPSSERKAKLAMMRTVSERGKYWYSYPEYMLVSFLRMCCCCCSKRQCFQRRLERLERHEEAVDKLANEIDIVKLLYVQRVGQFIAKLILKKH